MQLPLFFIFFYSPLVLSLWSTPRYLPVSLGINPLYLSSDGILPKEGLFVKCKFLSSTSPSTGISIKTVVLSWEGFLLKRGLLKGNAVGRVWTDEEFVEIYWWTALKWIMGSLSKKPNQLYLRFQDNYLSKELLGQISTHCCFLNPVSPLTLQQRLFVIIIIMITIKYSYSCDVEVLWRIDPKKLVYSLEEKRPHFFFIYHSKTNKGQDHLRLMKEPIHHCRNPHHNYVWFVIITETSNIVAFDLSIL